MQRSLNPAQFLLGCQGLALLTRWLRPGQTDVTELLESTMALARAANDFEALEVEDCTVEDCYRLQQETYDAGWNPLIELEQRQVWPLVPPARPGAIALDAACGTGRHAQWLASQGYGVVGIDASESMVRSAGAKAPAATFEVGRLEALPVGGATFDLVVCGLALALCESISSPIAELARVTKPGGTIVISDVHPASVMMGGSLLFETPDMALGVTQQFTHWHSAYLEAFRAAGLQVLQCLDVPWPPPVWPGGWYAPEGEARSSGQLMGEVSEMALAGTPGLLIWQLRLLAEG